VSFQLYVNDFWRHNSDYLPITDSEWIDGITHELGHALGVGTFWDAFYSGSHPPSNNFLNGTNANGYPLAQTAYNTITSLTRTLIPLESDGGAGTASAHWENNFRPASAPG
jgi:hypothetical protein